MAVGPVNLRLARHQGLFVCTSNSYVSGILYTVREKQAFLRSLR